MTKTILKALIAIVLITTSGLVKAQTAPQTYWTPGVPPKTGSFSLTSRADTSHLINDSLKSVYISNANKWYQIYTSAQSNSRFLKKSDSTQSVNGYVSWYSLLHNNWNFIGTPTFTNGINSNLTTISNGSGTMSLAGNQITGSNSFQLQTNNGSLTFYSATGFGGTYMKWTDASGFLQFQPYSISTGGLTGSGSNEQYLVFPQRILSSNVNWYLPTITTSDTLATVSRFANYLNTSNNPVINNATPLYLQSTFQAASQRLYIQASKDGVNFFPLNNDANSFLPNTGVDNVRDPSIMKYNGYYYAIHTSGIVGQCTYFLIERSTDMINWSYYSTLSTSAISPYYSWAPEWFVDPISSTVYVYFALVSTSSGTSPITLYYCTANSALNTFSTPTAVNITSPPSRILDPFMVYASGVYYLFYTEEDVTYNGYISCATATSPTGPFTITQSGNAFGFGGGFEGPCIIQKGSTYYMYIDNYGNNLGNYYSTSTNLTTWTTPIKVNSLYPSRHGTVIAVSNQTDINNILFSATMNAATNPLPYTQWSTGLTNSGGVITNNAITGIAGGQTFLGGTNASDNLYLSSTANSSKGYIYLGQSSATSPSYYYEPNRILSISGNSSNPMVVTVWAKDGNPGLYMQRWTGSSTNYANWRFCDGAGSSGQAFGIDYGATTSLGATPTWSSMFYINTSGQAAFGTMTPSSWLDLRAGTTSFASMIIPSGVFPTTKVAGQLCNVGGILQFYDSNNLQNIAYSPLRTTVADANYTALQTDNLIAYTSLSAARTVTLVAITTATATAPSFIQIKDESGNAGTDNITISAPGGKTIDGAASITINTAYGYKKLYYNGTNFFTVD